MPRPSSVPAISAMGLGPAACNRVDEKTDGALQAVTSACDRGSAYRCCEVSLMTSDTSRPPSTNEANFVPRSGTDRARMNQADAANRLDDAGSNPLCRPRPGGSLALSPCRAPWALRLVTRRALEMCIGRAPGLKPSSLSDGFLTGFHLRRADWSSPDRVRACSMVRRCASKAAIASSGRQHD